jgi:hypothetical protein
VPDNTPKAVRDWLDEINQIPAFHNKAPNSPHGGETPFDTAVKLVRDIGEGNAGPRGDMELRAIGHGPHESGDGVYESRRSFDKIFFPSNQSPEVRNWFRSWRNKEQAPSAPEPAKATPAKKAATPAALKQAERNVSEHIANMNKRDVEQSQRVAAAKKAAKAAPKVTQAELRSPVPKAGAEAPAAPQANVTAKGLTPGEGIPVSTRLAVENKLGARRTPNLNALDRAIRSEATRAKVPELMAKIETELAQAGVGPNDEPRKSLMAWYREHFG